MISQFVFSANSEIKSSKHMEHLSFTSLVHHPLTAGIMHQPLPLVVADGQS